MRDALRIILFPESNARKNNQLAAGYSNLLKEETNNHSLLMA